MFPMTQNAAIRLYVVISLTMLCTLCEPCFGQLPSGYNRRPLVDTGGKIVDAHDGMLAQFNGTYYLYGTAYGQTDGSQTNINHYRCYSSPDLVNWTLAADYILKTQVGSLYGEPPAGLYFRPHVIYNSVSGKYVLWYNWWTSPFDGQSYVNAAVSSSPTGPFVINSSSQPYSYGDFNLFVDDPVGGVQNAYMITAGAITVRQLNPADFLTLNGASRALPGANGEAPILFKGTNTYYAMWGPSCAFCPAGSSCYVLETTDPTPLAVC